MRALTLVVVDTPPLLPGLGGGEGLQGGNVIRVTVEFQCNNNRFSRIWHLGEIEARVVELAPQLRLDSR